jgi:hypothetical protein
MNKILITVLLTCAIFGGGSLGAEPRAAAAEAPAVTTAAAPTDGAPPGQLLSEEESAEWQARAEEPGDEVTGGALSNEHLTYIVIALAAAVLVLVLK